MRRSPSYNHDRARRAQEVIQALVADGAPCPFWVAIKLEDGRTQGAAFPSKKSAIEHCANPNEWTFMVVLTPIDVPSVAEIISFMRYSEMKESYWRTQHDMHLHIPKHGLSSGDASAFGA